MNDAAIAGAAMKAIARLKQQGFIVENNRALFTVKEETESEHKFQHCFNYENVESLVAFADALETFNTANNNTHGNCYDPSYIKSRSRACH
jgi:CRISPR/Cas system CMR subunit Cmr6 (Cas7 group RAMP superfamily)